MKNLLYIKEIFILSLVLFFSNVIIAQEEITDKEIGFNREKLTLKLTKRGLPKEEINSIIEVYRDELIKQFNANNTRNESFILNKSAQYNTTASSCQTDVPLSEKNALIAFYNQTWTSNTTFTWNFNDPVSTWTGVTVSADCHVTGIILINKNLGGSLPYNMFNLPFLEHFVLSGNNIGGVIPSEISQLTSLRSLKLSSNNFTGEIPNISALSNLEELNLSSNPSFNPNPFPNSVLSLLNLKTIHLSSINMNGSIPSNIGVLNNLEVLYLNGNDIGDNSVFNDLPSSLFNLTNLKKLILSNNNLTGDLSPLFNNLQNLDELRLNLNNFSGALTNTITNLPNLKYLNVIGNFLSGNLPTIYSQSLEDILFDSNDFTGNIPYSLTTLPNLRTFRAPNNLLEGNIFYFNNIITNNGSLSVYGNKFRFNDFINTDESYFMNFYNLTPSTKYTYSPQAKTDNIYNYNIPINTLITMTMYEDGNFHPEDEYQWYKNNAIISGAVNRQYTFTTDANSGGVYHCVSKHFDPPFTNSINAEFRNLILTRNNITINIVPYTEPCVNCTSFDLLKGEKYLVSGWAKEANAQGVNSNNISYTKSNITISFVDVNGTLINAPLKFYPSGAIIDGWQRIVGEFVVPSTVDDMNLELVNEGTLDSFFDDIRIIPSKGNMKSFVYDQKTQRLMAELDENNYATFYEYDLEGGLIRVKKETEKGIYTIQETRSSTRKN